MINLTDENFEKEISNAQKPVLVDFWAIWCMPCLILSPILEKLEKEFEGKIILAKLNVDAAPKISQIFGINSIPTVILFKEGKAISGFIGVRPEENIKKWLEENINKMKDDSEKIKEIIKESEEYAAKAGFKLNPNRKVVEWVAKGLLENERKYGFRYCPCRRVSGNPEEDKGKICPCQWHREEIEKDGHCHCGLFVK